MKEVANLINVFVDSVKALNKYTKTVSTKLTSLRGSIKEAAFAVFDADGTWKDCLKALEESEVKFNQSTLEQYAVRWKEERAKANGETPKKQNTGRPQSPAMKKANEESLCALGKGYPMTLDESIAYCVAFGTPLFEASIKEMHNTGNLCFVPESASDLDKQLAIVNTQEAARRAFRQSQDGMHKANRASASLANKSRETEKSEA